jgi:hypothetical protein
VRHGLRGTRPHFSEADMKIKITILVMALAVSAGIRACTCHDGGFRQSDHFDGRRFHNTAFVLPENFSDDVQVT